jgi:hypothetical protein
MQYFIIVCCHVAVIDEVRREALAGGVKKKCSNRENYWNLCIRIGCNFQFRRTFSARRSGSVGVNLKERSQWYGGKVKTLHI